jgi:hypothetical protein
MTFVIRDADGLFLTNDEGWHREPRHARQYDGPRAMVDAEEEAVKLRRFGSACEVVVSLWTWGGYFVVRSSDGLYWTGETWQRERPEAQQFSGPRAFEKCEELVFDFRKRGHVCNVAFVPGSQVNVG